MRKIISILFLAPAAAFAAVPNNSARVGMYGGGATGRPAANMTGGEYRQNIPVPITITPPNVHVPGTTPPSGDPETVNPEIDGKKKLCLDAGNVWGNKFFNSFDGVLDPATLAEAEKAEDNICYARVSVKSGDIKDMGRFFPPRWFAVGNSMACGSWLDSGALDDAILDAGKKSRTGWTIAASVAGAGVGFGLTDLIGSKVIKRGFNGQADLDPEVKEQLEDLVRSLKKTDPQQLGEYQAKVEGYLGACNSGYATDGDCNKSGDSASCKGEDNYARYCNVWKIIIKSN